MSGFIKGFLRTGLFGFALSCTPFFEFDEPEERVITDGQVCAADDECSTKLCARSASLCSHSLCKCADGKCSAEGEPSSWCRGNWVCVERDSILDPVKEFFGGMPKENDGYCQPTCANGCPEHYHCDASGRFCRADTNWAYPSASITWTGAVEGSLNGREQSSAKIDVVGGAMITVSGLGMSPIGESIEAMTWTTVSGAGDYETHSGPSVEVSVPTGSGDYRRVELVVSDASHRSGTVSVIFNACLGPGATCGFGGSGCCNGCEDETNVCL